MIWDKNVSSLFPRFIPFSAFYPFFRVLSLFPRFILFSAFYPFFRVLSLFPHFILFSAFYPFFRVLSLFPRFIPFSAFYPFFRVLSLFPPPQFRISVIPDPCFIPTPQVVPKRLQNKGCAKETFAPLWRPRSETRHALVNAVTLEALA